MKKNTKKLNKYLSLSLGVGMTLGSLIQPISVVAEPNEVVQNEQNKVIPKESIEDVQNEPISNENVLPQETNSEIGEKNDKKSEEKLNNEIKTKSLNDDDFFNWYNDLSKEEKKNFINSLKEKYGEIDDEFPKYYSIHDMMNGKYDEETLTKAQDFWMFVTEEGVDLTNIEKMVSKMEMNTALKFMEDFSEVMSEQGFNLVPKNEILETSGSLYPANYGENADFLSHGSGSIDDPYVIDSVDDLRGLSKAVADGETFEDKYFVLTKSTYDLQNTWIPIGFTTTSGGNYVPFKGHVTSNVKGGSAIRNLGFNGSASGVTSEKSTAIKREEAVGLFGKTEGASISNLIIQTDGNTIEGDRYTGALIGYAVDTTIRNVKVQNCKIKGNEFVGGIVGFITSDNTNANERGSVIEDVSVIADVFSTNESNRRGGIGGVAGKAMNTIIADADVKTNTGAGKHIYGHNDFVGGIVGIVENADLYNTYLTSGEIGSSDSFAVGGLVGGYQSGQIKVGRFAGTLVPPTNTNNYKASFIGTTINGAGFTYGKEGDVAYLFTNNANDASFGICGSKLVTENQFDFNANIGYWHSSDNYFTLVNGNNTERSTDLLFYEKLEEGILNIKKTGNFTSETDSKKVNINHFTCDNLGKPVRGYLLSVIDPTVNGNVAAKIKANMQGNNYKPSITSESLGAFKEGDRIYVSFADQSNGNAYYRKDEDKTPNPYYIYRKYDNAKFEDLQYKKDELDGLKGDNENVSKLPLTNDGGYWLTMPDADTVISADYKAVANAVGIKPDKVVFNVKQIRTGSRENPDIKWEVIAKDQNNAVITDDSGKKWINEDGSGVVLRTDELNPKFRLGSTINNGKNEHFNLIWTTSNTNVKWTDGNTRSGDIISVPSMVTSGLATDKSAYITLNIKNSVLNDYVDSLVKEQKANNYKDNISTVKPILYTANISAVAQRNDASIADTPATGYLPIEIKFSIEDKTKTSIQGVALDHDTITYNVVRELSGNRKNPTVKYTVNGNDPANTTFAQHATFNPDYFSNNSVKWYVSDKEAKNESVLSDETKTNDGVIGVMVSGTGDYAYRDANISLKGISGNNATNAFIAAKVNDQNDAFTSQLKKVPDTSFNYTKFVKVTAHDTNNNTVTDTCKVIVNFKTIDKTEILPETVTINDKQNMHNYTINYTLNRNNTVRTITEDKILVDGSSSSREIANGVGQKISASITPNEDNTDPLYQPYNKEILYEIDNPNPGNGLNVKDVLYIDEHTGQIYVRGFGESRDANNIEYSPWVNKLISQGRLNGTTVQVRVNARSAKDETIIDSKIVNVTFKGTITYSTHSGGGGGSSSGGGGGSTTTGVTTSSSSPVQRTDSALPSYVVSGGQWTQNALGKWYYTNQRTYTNEWAAVANPYAQGSQEKFSWFHFGQDSAMTTGWYTENGDTFYLNPISDNTQGRMFTGWNWIKGTDGKERCYFFETESNGHRGSLYKNRKTPDGYTVNENGEWIVNGIIITR